MSKRIINSFNHQSEFHHPPSEPEIGRLIKYYSNYYYVAVGNRRLACSLKGSFKKTGELPVVGDWLRLDSIDWIQETARIVDILPRQNSIERPKLANIDCVIVVHPVDQPMFDFMQVDRYLALAALAGIDSILCVTKSDLTPDNAQLVEQIQHIYADQLKYPVFFTSIKNSSSLQPIRNWLSDKVSVLAGPSGGGKSSLLNALNPALQLKVGDVSEKLKRGQHTTRHVELLSLDNEKSLAVSRTLIADTPGFSHVRFENILPEAIQKAFPETLSLAANCYYPDCLHQHETLCGVLTALENNQSVISQSRYASYCTFLEEVLAFKESHKNQSRKTETLLKDSHRAKGERSKKLKVNSKTRSLSRRYQTQYLAEKIQTESHDTL
ncbi:MAG: ribosome small subunit-dependent GTPase A [Cyanobacteria bacterium P01_H01_bin.74]